MKRTLTLRHLLVSASVFVLLMVALSPLAYGQLFDDTFNPTHWTSTILPYPLSNQNAQDWFIPGPPPASPTPCASGQYSLLGTPSPPSRQTCTYFPSGSIPAIWVAQIYQPFIYDPATQGAIASVSFSYDLNPPDHTPTYTLLLLQNGRYFMSANSVSNPSAPNDHPGGPANSPPWKHIQHGNYTAEEFQEVSNIGSTVHPDFSCNGLPIKFGYLTGTSGGNYWSVSRIDNWKVDITKVGCLCFARANETIECGQGGSYPYSVEFQNLTAVTIPQISIAPILPTGVTVSPQTFSVSLAPNQKVTLNMSISGPPPGTMVLLRVFPSGVDSRCCAPEIRITLPQQGQCRRAPRK